MEESVKNLLNSLGAMAEMLGAYRDHLEDNGFDRSEAMALCMAMQGCMLSAARRDDDG